MTPGAWRKDGKTIAIWNAGCYNENADSIMNKHIDTEVNEANLSRRECFVQMQHKEGLPRKHIQRYSLSSPATAPMHRY